MVAILAVLGLAGGLFLIAQDDDEGGGSTTADGTTDPSELPDIPDSPALPDADSAGDTDLSDLPDPDAGDPSDTPAAPPPTDPPALEPADADVNDCIAVDSAGYLVGVGTCSEGGTPYRVIEVVEGGQSCPNPDSPATPSGGYLLCLENYLLETYCYVFPEANGGLDGWITAASQCEAPGTVHVIDLVPGATNGDGCTTDYEWNYWYELNPPQMVACVMKY